VFRPSYRSGLCDMLDVVSRGEELLALGTAAWHRMQPPLYASQATVGLSLSKAPMSSVFPLAQ
jgi:hypothetical protein